MRWRLGTAALPLHIGSDLQAARPALIGAVLRACVSLCFFPAAETGKQESSITQANERDPPRAHMRLLWPVGAKWHGVACHSLVRTPGGVRERAREEPLLALSNRHRCSPLPHGR